MGAWTMEPAVLSALLPAVASGLGQAAGKRAAAGLLAGWCEGAQAGWRLTLLVRLLRLLSPRTW